MHTLNRFLLLTLFCGLLPLAGRAQPLRELTADESVRLGLEHNALLRAAVAEAAEARAVYRQVRAGRLPSVSSQASYTRLSGNISGVEFPLPGVDTLVTLVPVELNRYYSEISVEQPLFTGFRLHNQIRAAAHQAEAAELEAEQERADVAFEIRQAYWRLFQALAAREALEAALAHVEEHLKDVRNRYEAGAALMSDLLSAQTRRSEVLLDRVEAENAIRVARLELNRLVGLPLDTPVQPTTTVDIEPLPADLDDWVTQALGTRPQIDALREQVEALEAQVDATQGAWFPELAVSGRYIYARPNQYFFAEPNEFKGTWEATLALRWDIWNGGQRQAETNEAQARLQAAEARLAYAREQIVVEVTRQYLEVQRASEAIQVAAQNVREASEAFRVVRQQYEEGAALSAQVLDAEEAFRMAQSRQAQALAEYAIARAALLNAVGQVW